MSARKTFVGALSARKSFAGALSARKSFAGAHCTIVAAVLLAGSAGSAAADPASSAETAWAALPVTPGEAREPLADPRLARGRDVFDQRCAACHGAIPEEIFGPRFLAPMPGTQALAARYQGALPAELEQRTDLDPAYVEAVVRDGLRSMPFFRPTEVSQDDLEALIAWLTRPRSAEPPPAP